MTRVLAALAGATALLALLSLINVEAQATPIRPNLQKLLAEPQGQEPQFVPARAGWNGPEMKTPAQEPVNPEVEAFTPAATARAVRASLRAAAIPDPRAVAAVLTVILLLRRVRKLQPA